jgi:CubicO group peptidase (beta-lactamase class C family)
MLGQQTIARLKFTICYCLVSSGIAVAQTAHVDLPRSQAEPQGIESTVIAEFVSAANEQIDSLHSLMLVRHGQVVAEGWWNPYDANTPHQLYSLSKSFTSIAVGLAIAEGKLSLDDQVSKYFPQDMPSEPSGNLQAMRVRDLLTMSTGHQSEPKVGPSEAWTKTFLAQPVPFKPGTHFLYNTPATYMCSAIVQQQTGQTVFDFLRPRLFEPLGFKHSYWGTSPQGVTLGGYGLHLCTEDVAKFGQLLLQRGQWNGKQLVPAQWIDQATSKQTSNGSNPDSDWDQGYGFQFWRSRHNCYRGDGAFGQYCIVMPEHDMVIAITSGVKDMPAVLNLVWDKLLPGIKPGKLAENNSAHTKLQQQLKSLQLPALAGNGKLSDPALLNRQFDFETNDQKLESLKILADENASPAIQLAIAGETIEVPLGQNKWQKLRVRWGTEQEQSVATTAAWTNDNECTIKVCFAETPTIVTNKLSFEGSQVNVESQANVSFGPAKRPTLVGQAQ